MQNFLLYNLLPFYNLIQLSIGIKKRWETKSNFKWRVIQIQ